MIQVQKPTDLRFLPSELTGEFGSRHASPAHCRVQGYLGVRQSRETDDERHLRLRLARLRNIGIPVNVDRQRRFERLRGPSQRVLFVLSEGDCFRHIREGYQDGSIVIRQHSYWISVFHVDSSLQTQLFLNRVDESALVVLVDEVAARHFWGAQDPIGKRIRSTRTTLRGAVQPAPWFTVVGVVGNVKLASLDEKDVPHVYTSLYQTSGYTTPGRNLGVLVRGTGDRAMLSRTVPREIQSVDPNLPVSPIVEMTELIRDGIGDRRFAASLLACFAVVALLLMSIGVYGVASYAIVRREKEIGIRSAL
jgi:hypothetical protein